MGEQVELDIAMDATSQELYEQNKSDRKFVNNACVGGGGWEAKNALKHLHLLSLRTRKGT